MLIIQKKARYHHARTSGTSYKIIGLWCYSFFHICFAYFDAHYNMIPYNVGAMCNKTLNQVESYDTSDDYILSLYRIYIHTYNLASQQQPSSSSYYFPYHKGILSNLFGLKMMHIIIMLIFSQRFFILLNITLLFRYLLLYIKIHVFAYMQ